MIYLDSSSLLKTISQEEETEMVVKAISFEECVIISILTELEVLNRFKANYLGGLISLSQRRRLETKVSLLRNKEPYSFRSVPSTIFQTALRQNQNSQIHCRSMDRLHLAVMEELEISRLMTHDKKQATAARELGFEVISPGRD